MTHINNPFKPKFPNRAATAATIVLWSLIGCLAWTMVSIFLAVSRGRSIDDHGGLAFIMYAGIGTGCLSFGLVVGYIGTKSIAIRTEKVRQQILADQILVHWRYKPEEWRRFRQVEVKAQDAAMKTLRFATGFFIIVPLIVGGFAAIFRPGHDAGAIFATVLVCTICLIVSTLILLCGTRADARLRELLKTPQDSYISTFGAHLNGRWIVWGTTDAMLRDIRIDVSNANPPYMEFAIDMGQNIRRERVLIPMDQLLLAHKIAEAITHAPEAAGGAGLTRAMSTINTLARIVRDFTR